MIVTKKQVEGSVELSAAAGLTPTRAIVIPLVPLLGAWVITGTITAMRADGVAGPVTLFPRVTGSCINGVAIANSTATMAIEPVDGGVGQSFAPGGISWIISNVRGRQVEIALTGVTPGPGVAICWAWDLSVLMIETP